MAARSKQNKNSKARRGSDSSQTSRADPSFARWLIPASVAFVTFVAFLPSLQNSFVNWDDGAFLLDNPHYRGLGWQQLRWMFTTCYMGSCMPLNYVTYAIDYIFWGMNPVGYHLSSLLVHVANAAAFYFLSLRLLRLGAPAAARSRPLPIQLTAGFSALLFSLHPLRVEVVAWTLGREIAVAGFFFLLTLLCYLRAAENKAAGSSPWRWMGAAWLFYALSLLGKEAALTLPFALFVLDVYPLMRLGGGQGRWFGPQVRIVWLEKVPFLLIALAAGLKAVWAKEQSGTLYPVVGYGVLPRFAQVLYSLGFYPWKTLVPIGLSPLYPLHPFTGPQRVALLLSGALVFALSLALFLFRRRWPAALAAWTFYVLLLLPVSGIVAFGPYIVADRFSYLPCLGWVVLAAAGMLHGWRLWMSGWIGRQGLVATQASVVLLLIGLGALTWNQTRIWHDSERLWTHALALDEESSFAHNNLGLVLAERGELTTAINHFRRAVEIDPLFVEAHTNLGNFLARSSPQEAIAHLRKALEIDPRYANAHNTLGNILADGGELDDAIEHFRKALQTNPQFAMAHYNLGRTLARRGDTELAVAHYRAALKITPADADAHNNLGLLLARQGRLAEAIEQFREALRIDRDYAKAYFNLGKIFMQQERLDDAAQHFRQALQLQPGVAEIHQNLARVFARQGKKEEAVKEYEEALRLLKSKAS